MSKQKQKQRKSLQLKQMKLIIKTKSNLKLYAHKMEYDALVAFIKTEFPEEQDYSITYQDSDGDEVVVSSQIDLDALVSSNENKQFVKVVLKQTSGSSQDEKIETKEIKKPKKERSGKKHHHEKKERSEKKEKKPKQEKSEKELKKVEESPLEEEVKDPKIHEGIQCFKCKTTPIVGVRYACLECAIDLCSACQENFQHQHDLLKIKQYRGKVEMKKQFREMKKMGRKFLREAMRQHGFSSSSGCQSKEKHWKARRAEKDPKIKQEMLFKRKCRKMSKFFDGKPEQFEQFIRANPDLDVPETISLYAKENNINMEEKFKDRFQKKINKLSLFFNKAAENYEQFVKDHPQENFRGLIKLLKEQGLEDYDGDNFKNMMKKAREERIAAREERIAAREEKILKKQEKQEKKAQKVKTLEKNQQTRSPNKQKKGKNSKQEPSEKSINKGIEMRQKGKILLVMKDLFGQQNGKKYFQFIENNFELGQDKIIEKYIQENFSQH